MKSYKHLFDITISGSNRQRAIKQAKRTKRVKKMLKRRNISDEELMKLSKEWILQYENRPHTPVYIHEGPANKLRRIIVRAWKSLSSSIVFARLWRRCSGRACTSTVTRAFGTEALTRRRK